MNILMKIKKYIINSDYRFLYNSSLGLYNNMPDDVFLKKKYKSIIGKELCLINPKTFNEKLQWLKINERKPEYTMMVDKYKVRQYIADKLGKEYLIPLLGVWKTPDEIDFDKLPNQFVLKCNHNSGLGMYICKDKAKLNITKVKNDLNKGLKQNYYLTGREWPYKNVPRRIIAEKFMVDESGGFVDYKFFCFNGVVDCVMVCLDRHLDNTKFYFFDKNWNLKRLNIRGKNAPSDFTIRKPKCMDEMFKIAETLSKGIPFVRIDLYESFGQIFFGEYTFYPDSGFDPNLLPETDRYFGNLIVLNKEKK